MMIINSFFWKPIFIMVRLKATDGSNEYYGTWSTNNDYSKLDISLPDSIPVFPFLSRSWRFTKKANPTLELAPWGGSAPCSASYDAPMIFLFV